MKKTKYIISLLTLLLLFPYTTYADCSEEIKDKFREIKNDYYYSYEFNRESNTYTLKLHNGSQEFVYGINKYDEKSNEKYTMIKQMMTFITCMKKNMMKKKLTVKRMII